ncbi:MAG: GNAT family N-acetyltransferase [Actinomycetales bacterium]|nr:GNAT family N-acetyltransferase [Actinomycetales bacterium]
MLFDALNDERVGRYIGGPDVTTVEALYARIEHLRQGPSPQARQSWLNFAVLLDSTVVGRVEATVHSGIAEIAYLIGPRYWGQGFGREAAGLLLEQVSLEGVSDVWATTEPDNVASVNVLVQLGFRESEAFAAPPLLSYDDGDRIFHRSDEPPAR